MSTVETPTISTWNVDSTHSVVEFKVKHMMISNLKGQFTGVTGTLSLHEADLTQSSVEAAIAIASIHTRDESRDAHLKGADFFDAEQFPTMQLKSTHIALKSDGELVVTGDLTIKGVTRSVQFAVDGPSPATKDPWGNTRIGVEATTKINRKDFGLTWNAVLEAGGVIVGEYRHHSGPGVCESGIRAALGVWKDDPPLEHSIKACPGGAQVNRFDLTEREAKQMWRSVAYETAGLRLSFA